MERKSKIVNCKLCGKETVAKNTSAYCGECKARERIKQERRIQKRNIKFRENYKQERKNRRVIKKCVICGSPTENNHPLIKYCNACCLMVQHQRSISLQKKRRHAWADLPMEEKLRRTELIRKKILENESND